jgi:aminopeptidase N
VDWSDNWLNEGFASYAEWLWAEYNGGEEALNEAVSSNYQFMSGEAFLDYGYTEQEAIAQARQFGAPGEPTARELFNPSVYTRGGLTLHALRLAVGDEAFFEILRTYAERFQYGNARTADFIALAEEISGRDLGKFFNEWLYEVDLPPIPELGLAPLAVRG